MNLTTEKLEKQAPYYYPEDFDVNNWVQISAAYDELEHKRIDTPRDLLIMLYQANELLSLIVQEYYGLYFRTIADTTDEDAKNKLSIMLDEIMLPLEKRNAAILKKYLEHPMRRQLSQENYRQLNASFEDQLNFSLKQNPDATIEINNLVQEYRQLLTQIEIDVSGEKYPLNIVGHLISKTEPEQREAIWNARKKGLQEHRDKFHAILDRYLKSTHTVAKENGFQNYYEYSLSTSLLGKLSTSQVSDIHKAIRRVVLPEVRNFIKQRQKRLNQKKTRPWDLEADDEASALEPFRTTDELISKAISVLYDIRFEYGILLNKMQNSGFLNLGLHPHKVKGEFNGYLPQWNAGSIYMCCTGHHRDMVMFFHEMGHVLQNVALMRNPLSMFYELPVQARELASQSLVYISTANWDEFYPDLEDRKTAFRCLYEYDLMQVLYWSQMNNFERVLHTNPDWTPEQREKALRDIWKQYDWGVDWSGLEDWQNIMWLQDFTMFEFPQYNFLSSLSIFNVWQILRNYHHDTQDTINRFQHFLERITELSADDICHELNIKRDFSDKHMQKMIDYIKSEYKRMRR